MEKDSYFTPAEAEKLTGVPKETQRRWYDFDPHGHVKHTAGGHRRFTVTGILFLAMVRNLMDNGASLEEAKEISFGLLHQVKQMASGVWYMGGDTKKLIGCIVARGSDFARDFRHSMYEAHAADTASEREEWDGKYHVFPFADYGELGEMRASNARILDYRLFFETLPAVVQEYVREDIRSRLKRGEG